jgi:hypothetical protein
VTQPKEQTPPDHKSLIDSPGPDEAGAAFFEYMLECIEDWTAEHRISWYATFGAISLLETYMKDLMLGRIQGPHDESD